MTIYGVIVDEARGFECVHRGRTYAFPSYAEARLFMATHPGSCIRYWEKKEA